MGKRRIRDLKQSGCEVTSWDATDGCDLFGWRDTDLLVVSTPPKAKGVYAEIAQRYDIPCFTEADVEPIDSPHLPSATPLFTDWYPRLVSDIDVQASQSYILHVGQHIDDWHPGADRATYYAYQDATGPTREMLPFELIWLTKLFGPVEKATGQRSAELAAVRVEHARGVVGRIIIDAVSRPPIRSFEIFGACNQQFALTYSEDTYLREMRAFVESVEGGKPWPYSLAEERVNLEVLHTIERSG